ncbi:OLC1v1026441C1 [Oldenlandia corymbosa var. corymbosa]|nr:OLC1v1026441C1 [Oldenlandia corymbosa var. corymbosa]
MMEMDLPNNNCIKVADLGCCSGPNTFLTIQHIVQSIDEAWSQISDAELPNIQYFLNDLVSNDFNLVFKGLPQFYEELERKQNGRKYGSCHIAAMPGSFYGKLFPDGSMHFVHSSYCLHWLSQVPDGLIPESGKPRDKGSIYDDKASPSYVHQAFLDQFTRDFTMFLRMRSEEMVKHGQILLTFICKDSEEVEGSHYLSLMENALSDLVTEGYIEDKKLDTFNLPIYEPSIQEVKKIIENEESFKILKFQTFKTCLDAGFKSRTCDDEDNRMVRARYVATYLRAVFEPILASHFGETIMDSLFHRFENKLANVVEKRQGLLNNLVISLRKE